MKPTLLLVTVSIGIFFCQSSSAEIIRCKGVLAQLGNNEVIVLDILIPERLEVFEVLTTKDGKYKKQIRSGFAGEGVIEIKKKNQKKESEVFVVTQLPGNGYSLIGYYIWANHPQVLRADLWDKGKPFNLYDSYNNLLIKGTCE